MGALFEPEMACALIGECGQPDPSFEGHALLRKHASEGSLSFAWRFGVPALTYSSPSPFRMKVMNKKSQLHLGAYKKSNGTELILEHKGLRGQKTP
jgi:hypothetical protein